MAILDEEKVKRLDAFLKFAREHWGLNPDGKVSTSGPSSLDEMDAIEVDGINIGEVYRELKAAAVKRMKTAPIEDAPSAEDLENMFGEY